MSRWLWLQQRGGGCGCSSVAVAVHWSDLVRVHSRLLMSSREFLPTVPTTLRRMGEMDGPPTALAARICCSGLRGLQEPSDIHVMMGVAACMDRRGAGAGSWRSLPSNMSIPDQGW